MRSRKYPHAVTLWRKGPEGADRKATWTRCVLDEANWQGYDGFVPGTQGDRPADAVLVLLPPVHVEALSKHDRMALGVHDDAEPPKDAVTVTSVEPVPRGRGIDHWEVKAS